MNEDAQAEQAEQGAESASLRDIATTRIRNLIFDGTLTAGDRVVERDIASELNISRLPVREAVQELAHEGLLVLHPRRAAVVKAFGEKEIAELLQVREALEVLAARLAASRARQGQGIDELTALDRSLQHAADAVRNGDDAEAGREAARWHELVVALADNELLNDIMRRLTSQMNWLLRRNHHHELMLAEHQRILEAIRSGDEKRAARLAEAHVKTSRRLFERKTW